MFKFSPGGERERDTDRDTEREKKREREREGERERERERERESTRVNSRHTVISYAVFCLKKKKSLLLSYSLPLSSGAHVLFLLFLYTPSC